MFRKHIIPGIAGLFCFLIMWALMGYLLPKFNFGSEIKGILKLAITCAAAMLANNYMSKKAIKNSQ